MRVASSEGVGEPSRPIRELFAEGILAYVSVRRKFRPAADQAQMKKSSGILAQKNSIGAQGVIESDGATARNGKIHRFVTVHGDFLKQRVAK